VPKVLPLIPRIRPFYFVKDSSRFLKKAAQKLLLLWVMAVAAQTPLACIK
jgi:hypothetical protein